MLPAQVSSSLSVALVFSATMAGLNMLPSVAIKLSVGD